MTSLEYVFLSVVVLFPFVGLAATIAFVCRRNAARKARVDVWAESIFPALANRSLQMEKIATDMAELSAGIAQLGAAQEIARAQMSIVGDQIGDLDDILTQMAQQLEADLATGNEFTHWANLDYALTRATEASPSETRRRDESRAGL